MRANAHPDYSSSAVTAKGHEDDHKIEGTAMQPKQTCEHCDVANMEAE